MTTLAMNLESIEHSLFSDFTASDIAVQRTFTQTVACDPFLEI
jgi:hypothetical protein